MSTASGADIRKTQVPVLILGALSLVFFLLARHLPSPEAMMDNEEMLRASRLMMKAMNIIAECRRTN